MRRRRYVAHAQLRCPSDPVVKVKIIILAARAQGSRRRGVSTLWYCRFHFASNGVNICVRAWHERSVTDLHGKPRQFKALT